MEVGIGVSGVELGDWAFDADLAAEGLPMKAQRGAWIFRKMDAFATFRVGEEAEAMIVDALCEDHAHGGFAGERRCGESCSVGVVGLRGSGFGEPLIEKSDGFRGVDLVWIAHRQIVAAAGSNEETLAGATARAAI